MRAYWFEIQSWYGIVRNIVDYWIDYMLVYVGVFPHLEYDVYRLRMIVNAEQIVM